MLSDAAKSGNELRTLEELRDVLAAEAEQATGAGLAQISRQLVLILHRISEIKPPEKERTALDELKDRRAAREARADGKGVATRKPGRG